MIGTLTDINSEKVQEKIIWQQANYDDLTGLPNRKFFSELLDVALAQAKRDEQNVWLMFLDLDGFKEVNDNQGHDIGDKLLVKVAERLKSTLREADTVARLGGDEFVVIITSVSGITDIDKIAASIIEAICSKYFIAGNEIFVTASIGIANYPRDARNARELLQYADQSMYAAKNDGKNRHHYFTASLQRESRRRHELALNMRTAIEQCEFKVYYQPIIDLQSNEIHKAEALIRWPQPDGSELPRKSFIPVAEATGMICDIGIWTLQQVLQQLEAWLDYDRGFQISINISPVQIKGNSKAYTAWLEELAASQTVRDRLLIEITENLLLDDDQATARKLEHYRALGLQLAIDDFGTGYSSLSYLQKFDIDFLKIDKSFVKKLAPGSTEEALCDAIITMGHSLGIKVIAEGVETQQQCDMLKALTCDFAQGYFFGKAVPPDAFESTVFSSLQ